MLGFLYLYTTLELWWAGRSTESTTHSLTAQFQRERARTVVLGSFSWSLSPFSFCAFTHDVPNRALCASPTWYFALCSVACRVFCVLSPACCSQRHHFMLGVFRFVSQTDSPCSHCCEIKVQTSSRGGFGRWSSWAPAGCVCYLNAW